MALWEEREQLKQENAQYKARLLELEQQQNQPQENSRNSSVPPSREQKANKAEPESAQAVRKASLGRRTVLARASRSACGGLREGVSPL